MSVVVVCAVHQRLQTSFSQLLGQLAYTSEGISMHAGMYAAEQRQLLAYLLRSLVWQQWQGSERYICSTADAALADARIQMLLKLLLMQPHHAAASCTRLVLTKTSGTSPCTFDRWDWLLQQRFSAVASCTS